MEEEKTTFPKIESVLIAGVVALLVFIGIIAAYPQGMKISSSHEVFFEGKNAFIAGESLISGKIKGICEMKNISFFNSSNVPRVEINGNEFTNVNVSIIAEEGEMDIDGILLSPPSFSLIMFNATEKKVYAMICKNISFNASTIAAMVKNASISINGITLKGNYTLILTGGFRSSIKAKQFSFPANGISISFKEGERDCGLIDKFLEETEIELPPIPFSIDGIFFAEKGNISVNGEHISSNFSIMRGEGDVFLRDGCSLHGNMRLLFINGEFYSEEKATILSFIPNKLLLFWPLAIGVWLVATFFEKKFGRKFEQYDKELGGIAFVIHLFFVITSFYLWDREINYLFGKSVIPALISSIKGNIAIQEWIIAPFEFIPWIIVIVLMAIPIRIILSSIFSYMGLETLGKGVGKGVGIFMSFFIGILYVSFFLTIIISPFIKGLIG
ncbi:MAG: hypothetical protein FE048_02540 [Thermoplasmata archaeon]|nr:MAG: hypothetical protein FE048_02540 [Thermoplasmata archaeon]